jgi:ketosteroid isomerase-like protein
VVALGIVRAKGRGSGIELEQRVGWVLGFKNGQVIRIRSFLDPAEALRSAGLE